MFLDIFEAKDYHTQCRGQTFGLRWAQPPLSPSINEGIFHVVIENHRRKPQVA